MGDNDQGAVVGMKYKPKRYFDNARLAVDLAIELGAKGTSAGTMSGFSDTPPDWKCPGCQRDKSSIARLNKHAEFYCAIHLHHDHSGEQVFENLGTTWSQASEALRDAVNAQVRFSCSMVCMDCNRIDAAAKKLVGAPTHFSFSAEEIAAFIIPAYRKAHRIDDQKLRLVFDRALRDHLDLVRVATSSIQNYSPKLLPGAA